jgi:hypothetical protein
MRDIFLETRFPLVSRQQIKACSLQDMASLRYLSEIPFWNMICPDYQSQKNVGNQMWSPLLLNSLLICLRSLFHELICTGSSTMTLSISWTQIHVFSIEKPQSNLFPVNSISISCRPTPHIPIKLTADSSSPCNKTPGKPLFGEIRVYRLPSNHCRPRETDLGFEFPASNNPRYHRCASHSVSFPIMFFWPGYKHTNTQTIIYFVRPSFQSRELEYHDPMTC